MEAVSTGTSAPACGGDCNGDGKVTVGELITAVNVALGKQPVQRCLPVDRDSNGMVSISELVAAVNRALNGC
jgi:Ca2+-binding EF-hand superfamily protein